MVGRPSPQFVDPEIWGVWKALCRRFSATRLILWDWYAETPTWSLSGVDLLGVLRRNRSTRDAFDLVSFLSHTDFQTLMELARINVSRQDAALRVIAVQFVSIPVTIFLAWAAYDAESLRNWVSGESPFQLALVAVIFLGTASFFLASNWRARQLAHVLELIALSRTTSQSITIKEKVHDG